MVACGLALAALALLLALLPEVALVLLVLHFECLFVLAVVQLQGVPGAQAYLQRWVGWVSQIPFKLKSILLLIYLCSHGPTAVCVKPNFGHGYHCPFSCA